MRIKATDPGARFYNVTCNGIWLDRCIEASEEEGWADVIIGVRYEGEGEVCTTRLGGTIQITKREISIKTEATFGQ